MNKAYGVMFATVAATLTVHTATHHHNRQHSAAARTVLAAGTVGTPYEQVLQRKGGTEPFTWSLAKGSKLPEGLTLDAATGVISGNPLAAGTTNIVSTVKDSSLPALTSTQSFTIAIKPEPLVLPSTMLASARVRQGYTQKLFAAGGTPPYTWSVASGRLPDGIKLDPQTGILTGTPIHANATEFTIQVTDSSALHMTGWQRAQAWTREWMHPSEEPSRN